MDPFERAAERERVDYQKLGFRVHLGVYLSVNALLFVTWLLTSGLGEEGGMGFPWFLFPLLGWGIGLVAHFAVYSVVSRDFRARQERRRAAAEDQDKRDIS
ncbi:MAG: 2TM domain-containing protein [Actinomycetota bacterium]